MIEQKKVTQFGTKPSWVFLLVYYMFAHKKQKGDIKMKCPICGNTRFIKQRWMDYNSKDSKYTCVHCGYTFSLKFDWKLNYLETLKELNSVLAELEDTEKKLKQCKAKIDNVDAYKSELNMYKMMQKYHKEHNVDNKESRSVNESINELEQLIDGGKNKEAESMCRSLEGKTKLLGSKKDELIRKLRDPFDTTVDIIKEASTENIERLDKTLAEELIADALITYDHVAAPLSYVQFVKVDKYYSSTVEKAKMILGLLQSKRLYLTNDESKASFIIVKTKSKNKDKRFMELEDFCNYWALPYKEI